MRALLAAGICAAVLALGGCGGDGDSASSATATTQASAPTTSTRDSATVPPASQSAGGKEQAEEPKRDEGSPGGGKGDTKQSGSATRPAHAVKLPPISSAPVAGTKSPAPGVKTVKGADDSVQTYGVESSSAERTQATLALAAYLDARRREDWSAACEALGQRPTEQLEKLTKSLSAQGKETNGCAAAMAALGEGSPQPPGTTITEVLSLRGGGEISGDPSYLIFSGPPGQTLYSMPMYLEGGWKVGLAVPAELPL